MKKLAKVSFVHCIILSLSYHFSKIQNGYENQASLVCVFWYAGLAETKYKLTIHPHEKIHCVSCEPPRKNCTDAPPIECNNVSSSLENAV